jgi:hypothetical protein
LAVASILSKLAVFVRSWIALKPILMKQKYLTFLAFFFPHRDISSNNAYGELTQWMIDLNEVYILLLGNCEAFETYILFSSVISTTIDLCVAGCSLFLPKQRVVITTTLLDAQETA